MTLVVRIDRGPLQRPTRAGKALVIEGHAARVHRPGDPLRYAHGDEYRDAAELRRIVEKLPGTPVTLPHPPGLIRDGAVGRVVGRVDSAWVDGEHAAVRLTVLDESAARAVEAGTKELSLGYACGIRTDGHQIETEVDHLAIVEKARCGATCSLRTDARLDCSATCACAQIDPTNRVMESGTMADEKKTDKQRADELDTANATLTAEVKRLEGIIAAGAQAAESDKVKELQTKLDEANAKIQRFDEALEKRSDALATLRLEAMRHLDAKTRLDGMTERQVHELVIKRLDASVNVASENDDQVRGRYNTLVALASRNVESQARVAEILGKVSTEAQRKDTESYEEIENNRWKKTLQRGRAAAQEGR